MDARSHAATARSAQDVALPARLSAWFAARGWRPWPHQLALMRLAQAGEDALLIAPTGAGKTLAAMLASLAELAEGAAGEGLHTLYVSPLKALSVDIARNLTGPISELGLDITVETRSGDTPASRKRRQRISPPDILVTTPEQVSLMISNTGMERALAGLRRIVIDEVHALAPTKRGVLLSLALARLAALCPGASRIGLSATVADEEAFAAWLTPQGLAGKTATATIVHGPAGAEPVIEVLNHTRPMPWSGHSARHAVGDILAAIAANRMTLVFVNTRSQAELIFQALWNANSDNLAIALHHGSLDVARRRKVEAAMARGELRAVVATSTLDLGIDWGDVDLVINVGAPKGSSRILQRIGRANHRLDEPSRAVLAPANRFEVLECEAARQAVLAGEQDSELPMPARLDVLAQHVVTCACAGPFCADDLYREVRTAWPYRDLERASFDDVVDLAATGGYALKAYERYARLRASDDGRMRLAHPRLAPIVRMNIGAIVEADMIKVRLVSSRRRRRATARGAGGKTLGEIEEHFIAQLSPGDCFVFAGQTVRFEGLDELTALVSRAHRPQAQIPAYQGGKFPLSTYLARRVRALLANPAQWWRLPAEVRQWLELQRRKSRLVDPRQMLVETFPRAGKHYLVAYPFAGRLAHQTLGMLLTRRLERAGARPLGFVANDYCLSVWGLVDHSAWIADGRLSLAALFDEDMLGDDFEAWLAETSMMKRTFKAAATIAGLINQRHPGREKSARQMTVSANLIYDVLRTHQPDHVLLRAARDDAAAGLIDAHRLARLLRRIKGAIIHQPLERISPLAVPVMLEIGREPVYGEGDEALLAEAAGLIAEAASASA